MDPGFIDGSSVGRWFLGVLSDFVGTTISCLYTQGWSVWLGHWLDICVVCKPLCPHALGKRGFLRTLRCCISDGCKECVFFGVHGITLAEYIVLKTLHWRGLNAGQLWNSSALIHGLVYTFSLGRY